MKWLDEKSSISNSAILGLLFIAIANLSKTLSLFPGWMNLILNLAAIYLFLRNW